MRESAAAYDARRCYVESSALLAALLEHDVKALGTLRAAHQLVTSALTSTECHRGLVRARAAGRLSEDHAADCAQALHTFFARCTTIAVTAGILQRAGRPFAVEPIRTLDAIHLATAEALGDAPALTTMLTRDARVRDNAKTMGFAIA